MSGDYEGLEAEKDNTDNQTASKINGKLDANSNSSNQSGATAGKTNNNLSLSANALRSQGVATEDTGSGSKVGDASKEANDQAQANTSGKGGSTMNMNAPGKKSIQAAAAVGLNITGHMAQTSVSGNITAGRVLEMLADNGWQFPAHLEVVQP